MPSALLERPPDVREGEQFLRSADAEVGESLLSSSRKPDKQQLAMNEILDNLAKEHPLQAQMVKLRYFVGMTNEETAEALDIAFLSTVDDFTVKTSLRPDFYEFVPLFRTWKWPQDLSERRLQGQPS